MAAHPVVLEMPKRAPVQLALWTEPAAKPKQRYRNSEAVAGDLFAAYERWAAKVALEMHSKLPMFDVDDLVQEAKVGLWKAALRYDTNSPVRFPVFAVNWVKGEVKMSTRRSAGFNSAMEALPEVEEQRRKLSESEQINARSRRLLDRMVEREAQINLIELRLSERSRRLLKLLQEGYTVGEIGMKCGLMVSEVNKLIEKLKKEAGNA